MEETYDLSKMKRVCHPFILNNKPVTGNSCKSWNYVINVLLAGTPEMISKVRCPVCGGRVDYSYDTDTEMLSVWCVECDAKSGEIYSAVPLSLKPAVFKAIDNGEEIV